MQASLLARGEPEAAAFVGACLIEVSAEDMTAPKPRPHLSIVTDGANGGKT